MSSSIDQVIADAVDSGRVPFVMGIVGNRDGVLWEGAVGQGRQPDARPVSTSSVVRMMSMTKLVTTTAALQAIERGDLGLDDPVATYRPEFADLQVLTGFDGDVPQYRDPASQATIQHLITHTAGLGYDGFNADLARWYQVTGTLGTMSGSAQVFTGPLTFDPGTAWQYSTGTDWLGLVLEAATGRRLDELIRDGVTGPLGMADTKFAHEGVNYELFTPAHAKVDGQWQDAGVALRTNPEFIGGGGGLLSSPRDYERFTRAWLRGGKLDGVRILPESVVDAAFTSQVGDVTLPPAVATSFPQISADIPLGGGTWGHGLLLTQEDSPGRRRAGSGSWCGLTNTYFWIDRTSGISASLYSSFLPCADPDMLSVLDEFERAVYAELV